MPGEGGELPHQAEAGKRSQQRDPWHQRSFKRSCQMRAGVAQDDESNAYEREGEERSDVRHIGGGADGDEGRHDRDADAGQDRGMVRCAEAWMNHGQPWSQETVA